MYGVIEAGGTKFVCAVMNDNGEVQETVTIATETPEVTMPTVIDFFSGKGVSAFGIGSFGPVEINPESDDYGKILNTPKIPWRNFNIYKVLKERFHLRLF
jgi:fructokinase